ncbi:MAG: excinuclease ABC subunit UvrC [Eubacterium sp.]|nr:excinuclease ABC subunit UvrC [Eubacterium sp.]
MFDIKEELKKLPDKPGVYIMHDKSDEIIYVGKALSLKSRVRQYFQKGGDGRAILAQLVPKIDYFEYIVTDSELEALVLENNLIKEHRPKYNTLLKDDKTYPYIKVTVGEQFPRVFSTRQMKKDSSKYFGPYTSAGAVKDTVELMQKLYKLRTCRKKIPSGKKNDRACLNYHMDRCPAPCQGYISHEDYMKQVDKALDFLGGNYAPLIKELEEKMYAFSEELKFEEAAETKELLNSVRAVAQKQKITASDGEDKDIIALARDERDAVIQVFFVRDGKLMGREHFYLELGEDDDDADVFGSFVKQYYSGTPFVPKELMLQSEVKDSGLIEEWLSDLRGHKVYIKVPKKGAKEKLVELAKKNAELVLSTDKEKLKREEKRTIGAMNELGKLTGVGELKRIEAYDISNISGYNMVGSMVVYENGKPKRNDYRKFRIKSLSGQNDYAAMDEVLTRRFSHGLNEMEEGKSKDFDSFTKFPDLILMDGGRGQVNIAEAVLEKLGIHIPVCGMVKDDHHRTRGLYVDNKEIPIDKSGAAFHLITRVQDEAHRFAITYHRSLRSKGQVHSVLDDVKGIGPARRKALMKSFESIDKMREASVEELADAGDMPENVARELYNFLRLDSSE